MAFASSDRFDPDTAGDNLLEALNEYASEFAYKYDALSREAPRSAKTEPEIKAWVEQDMRKIFLGRFVTRGMQKIFEEITEPSARSKMTFDTTIEHFRTHFKQTANTTLSNFKFRKIQQEASENFDTFVIRIKREAATCSFKCNDGCTVVNTLIRDQILIGTSSEEIRRQALKDEWELDDLIKKGKAIEAATKGAAAIKKEDTVEVNRTKPGKYSKKAQSREKLKEGSKIRCKLCSSSRCKGDKKCPGKKVSCFACGKNGHFRGAEICKNRDTRQKDKFRRRTRKVEYDSDESDTHSESSSTSTSCPESESSSDEEQSVDRIYRKIPIIHRVGGARRAIVNRTKQRYTVQVTIKEKKIPVFCDTGAEISLISLKNANKLKMDIQPTQMRIKPYGSRTQKCIGQFTGTVTFNNSVANTIIYILERNVETLLSGPVCEELSIIKVNNDVNRVLEEPSNNKGDEKKGTLMQEFPDLFKGIGTLKNHKVKFFVDESIAPVAQPPRPIPFHLREKMMKELRNMEDNDIIEPHHGPAPWVSNLVLAPKDNGSIRITVDMRACNKAIRKTHIPIPRPEEISSRMAGYQVFSKMDMRSAFHQLEIEEESRILTVFHAGDRLMRYKRLTMGCSPSSGELNKALRPLFQDLENVHVIQDDIIVAGRDQQEHDQALRRVCQTMMEAGMTFNPDKCIISQSKIPWWGVMISSRGLSPDPEKVKSLRQMSPPKSKDEARSFLCMINSNKDFITNLSRKTTFMRKLLKKNTIFRWTEECQKEFETLRKEFSEEIMLEHFNPQLKTHIQVDAHVSGLSAILMQEHNNTKRIVSTASRATTPTEARYPQLDLEALAVDFGLRRFRFYVAGAKVTIITDHKPLESIFKNMRIGSIRTERIKLRHQDLDYTVRWEKGLENRADYLSRHALPLECITKEERDETEELEKTIWFLQFSPYTEAISIERLIQATQDDTTLRKLKKQLKKGYITKDKEMAPYAKVFNQLSISDSGLILKEEKIILPSKLVNTAIKKAHKGSHPGMSSMKRRIRSHFWFPGLNAQIEETVRTCKQCSMFTNKTRRNKLHAHTLENTNAWERLSIDLFGPLPDKRSILVVQDMMSRFPAAKVLNKTDGTKVTQALNEIYTTYGTPMAHRTDNGPPFNSQTFSSFSDQNGIRHEKSFPYHPQANPAECFMKPLGKCMKAAHDQGDDKVKALEMLLSSYRATPHSATGIAPGDILFRHGYHRDFPKGTVPKDEEIRTAMSKDQQTREGRDEALNVTRKRDDFKIGDPVMTRNEGRTKFQPIFGPEELTVTAVKNGGVTCTKEDGTRQIRHQDDVKPAKKEIEEEEKVEEEETQVGDKGDKKTLPLRPKSTRVRNPNPNLRDYVLS